MTWTLLYIPIYNISNVFVAIIAMHHFNISQSGSYMYTLTGNKEEWEKAVSSGTTNIVSVKSRRIYLVWMAVIVECDIPLWQF